MSRFVIAGRALVGLDSLELLLRMETAFLGDIAVFDGAVSVHNWFNGCLVLKKRGQGTYAL